MLFGRRQTSGGESVANRAVGVEIYLPVVLVVAVGTNGKHWAGKREGQNLHVGSRVGEHVRNLRQVRLQQRDGLVDVNRVIELCFPVNSSERIGAEVLDDLGEDFPVSDNVADVVERVD